MQYNPDVIKSFPQSDYLLERASDSKADADEMIKARDFVHKKISDILQRNAKSIPSEQINFYLQLAENINCDLGTFYESVQSLEGAGFAIRIIEMCQSRILRFDDIKCFHLLLDIQKRNVAHVNIPRIFEETIKYPEHEIARLVHRDESVKKIFLESAKIGLASKDFHLKLSSVKILALLGEDISAYQEFIFKGVLVPELRLKLGLTEDVKFFVDQIKLQRFDIDVEDAFDFSEIMKEEALTKIGFLSNQKENIDIINVFRERDYISAERHAELMHVFGLLDISPAEKIADQENLTQENWALALSRYALVDGGLLRMDNEEAGKLAALFSTNHPANRELCLGSLQRDWKNFLTTGMLAFDSEFISQVCHRSEGMGDLKYVENISYMIHFVNRYLRSDDIAKKTADSILNNLSAQELRFEKENWSEEDKSFFYSVSKDILSVSPSLYTDFLDIFEKLEARDMKAFIRDYFASYQAVLIVLDKGQGKYGPRDLLSVRKKIREVGNKIESGIDAKIVFEEDQKESVEFLKEKFMSRYGIIKVPEVFDHEKIKILENFIKYNANLNDKDKDKEAILAFYMALSINGDWQAFKEGQEIDVEQYLSGDNLSKVKAILSERAPYEYIKSFGFDIEEADIPKFMKILQDETISTTIGNIETVDVKLGNIKRAMADLEDADAYEHEEDKQVLELYKKEGKMIASTLAKIFSIAKGKGGLTEKEEEVKGSLSAIYGVEDWNQEIVKKIQESTRGIALVHGILEKIEKEDIDQKISQLESALRPTDAIIKIFSKVDEDFKPNSGAIALSEDLIYLENIIAKNQDKLNEGEKTELSDYLGNIRDQMKLLEQTTDHLKGHFEKLKKSIHGSNKVRLQERLAEIEKIIYSDNRSVNIVSRMTGNLSDVITNIRQCLGCLSPQCNNDTNLTFGEPYKFLMLSQNGSKQESMADQLVMCVPAMLENGERVMSFVLDTAYGVKSADVLFGNLDTIKKKMKSIAATFPNVKTTITVPLACLNSVGLSERLFIERYRKDNPDSDAASGVVSVEIPKSNLGDNYAEYGVGGTRPVGALTLSGVIVKG